MRPEGRGSCLSGNTLARWDCPRCGFLSNPTAQIPPDGYFFRPWHLTHGRSAVEAYVKSLGEEAHEWLLALYVDADLQLLAVDTVARGSVSNCPLPFWRPLNQGCRLNAAGFILVHNHPSGDPTPSRDDVLTTVRLAHLARELNVSLIDHLIIAGDEIKSCGHF